MLSEQLVDDLIRMGNVSVLQGICRALAVDYGRLPGLTLAAKAGALVGQMGENGRLLDLATELIERQPHLASKYTSLFAANTPGGDWIDDMTAGEDPLADTMITMQWPGEEERIDTAWLAQNLTEARRQVRDEVTLATTTIRPEREKRPLTNPYQPQQPLLDRHMFFGRDELLAQLAEAVQQGESIAVVGTPHVGKTSLLLQLCQLPQLTTPLLLAYADLGSKGDEVKFVNRILGQWVRQLEQTVSPPKLTGMVDFARWVRALTVKGFHPVLCLDGVADGTWVAWESLLAEGIITVVTASRRPLAELQLSPTLHRLLRRVDVGLLPETAVSDLLTLPITRAGLDVPEGLVPQLHKLCGSHPLYLHIAGHLLFAGLSVRSYSWATLRDGFMAQARPYWQVLWDSLSAGQQLALQTAVRPQPFPAPLQRTAQVLLRQGLLLEERGEYRPFSQGFGDWLRDG